MKKILFVIPFNDFRDEEYFVPRKKFELKNFEIKVASNKLGVALGADGGEVKVDSEIKNIDIIKFDALVFIGGPGCLKYLNNQESYKLIIEANYSNKIIGAICISPVILAESGILKNKKATVWTSSLDKSAAKFLEEKGAFYQNQNIAIDNNIITADGPSSAEKFSEAIISQL
jgi:protease I